MAQPPGSDLLLMTAPFGPILVVDDDLAVRNALKFALEIEGLSVRLYAGAADLLADAALPPKGCLVVDYNMPAMNGIELVDALHRRRIDWPIILIAGSVNQDLRSRAGRSGIGSVLEKPLSDGALLDSIRRALTSMQAGD